MMHEIDMTVLWRNQPVEGAAMSLHEIRRKTRELEKRVRWRNGLEYVSAVIVTAVFGFYIAVFDSALIRTGCGMIIAGTLFVVYLLHKRGAARATPAVLALQTCVVFHRRELERQRDLLGSVWSWYLLPFVPGLVVFLCGHFVAAVGLPDAAARLGAISFAFALPVAAIAAVFVWIWFVNRAAARRLQLEIDALDGLEKES